ncbi:hypothetical protein RUM44_002963 [Polyplax serrata]|uniref:Uncharacterized protein n=1 Tax=Polyplax serrata TaxID=468196 RepID=A0ABR1AX68_POLSC
MCVNVNVLSDQFSLNFNELERWIYLRIRLQYLTTVKPHKIVKDPWLVDEYVRDCLEQLLDKDVISEFGRYTCLYYTEEGHYNNLWKYDRKTPFRYHPGKTQLCAVDSPKIRHVWGKAFDNLILEGMTGAPLIQEYQRIRYPIATGIHIYVKGYPQSYKPLTIIMENYRLVFV